MLHNFRALATAEHRATISQAVARWADENANRLILGWDSRDCSSRIFETLPDLGRNIILLGVTTTPALAWACKHLEVAGAMVTASHLPHEFAGVKFWRANGAPATADQDAAIATAIHKRVRIIRQKWQPPSPDPTITAAYFNALWQHLPARRIAIEVPAGLAELFRANSDLEIISRKSMDPQSLWSAPRRPILLRVDGDCDQLVMWRAGRRLDGQSLLRTWVGSGTGKSVVVSCDTLVSTQERWKSRGNDVRLTRVGDQFVAEALQSSCTELGGEPNGHLIDTRLSYAPDAVAAGLRVASLEVDTAESRFVRIAVSAFDADAVRTILTQSEASELNGIYQFSWADSLASVRFSDFENSCVVQIEGGSVEESLALLAARAHFGSTRKLDANV